MCVYVVPMQLDERKLRLLRAFVTKPGCVVVDLCSGDCRYLHWLVKHIPVSKAYAIDKNCSFAEACKPFQFICGEIGLYSCWWYILGGAFADYVLLFDCLEHSTFYGALLDAAHYFLAPGGLLIGSTIGEPVDHIRDAIERDPEHVHLFNPVLLRRALERHGFRVIYLSQDHEILFFVGEKR